MEEKLITGNMRSTSTQLRLMAINVIRTANRPLSPSDIVLKISQIDRGLAAEIKEKCDEYVRMILRQTRRGVFRHYVSKDEVVQIDGRSRFFGLASVSYASEIWDDMGDPLDSTVATPTSTRTRMPAKTSMSGYQQQQQQQQQWQQQQQAAMYFTTDTAMRHIPAAEPEQRTMAQRQDDLFGSEDANEFMRLMDETGGWLVANRTSTNWMNM